MYRQASRLLARTLAGGGRRGRPFSTDIPAASPAEDMTFVEAWKKVSPNIDPPKTPLSFMKPRPPTPSSIPSKLTVNFVLPYQSEISSKELEKETEKSQNKIAKIASSRQNLKSAIEARKVQVSHLREKRTLATNS